MVGIIQEKQTPKIAKKLLKVKISCNSSHCKANCNNILAVCVCVRENINTQLQNKCTWSQGGGWMELSPSGPLLRHFQVCPGISNTKYHRVSVVKTMPQASFFLWFRVIVGNKEYSVLQPKRGSFRGDHWEVPPDSSKPPPRTCPQQLSYVGSNILMQITQGTHISEAIIQRCQHREVFLSAGTGPARTELSATHLQLGALLSRLTSKTKRLDPRREPAHQNADLDAIDLPFMLRRA